jgi:hypothetical protein
MICPSRPLELRQSVEDMEQEFALRRGGVHLLGQGNVPPRVFRYRPRATAPQPQAPFSAEFGGFRSAAFSLCPLMLQKWAVR